MLTPQQRTYFDTFGFLHLHQHFAESDITMIRREAEAIWQQERRQRQLADDDYLHMAPFMEHSPALLALLEDDRIYRTVEALLGPGFLWSGSEGNTGAAQANSFHAWHCDRPGEADPTYRRLKIMIYLTPMTKDNGCLRVLPGSHRLPLYRALTPLNEQGQETCQRLFGVPGEALPCHPLETVPGDVVIFDHYLYHAVYGGDGSRRYVAMKFVSRPETGAHLASLLDKSPYLFTVEEALRNSPSARIQSMIDGLDQIEQQARSQHQEQFTT